MNSAGNRIGKSNLRSARHVVDHILNILFMYCLSAVNHLLEAVSDGVGKGMKLEQSLNWTLASGVIITPLGFSQLLDLGKYNGCSFV